MDANRLADMGRVAAFQKWPWGRHPLPGEHDLPAQTLRVCREEDRFPLFGIM